MIKRIVVTKYRLSSPHIGEAEEFDDLLAARDRAVEVLRATLIRRILRLCNSGLMAEKIADALAGDIARAQETFDIFKDFVSPCIDD